MRSVRLALAAVVSAVVFFLAAPIVGRAAANPGGQPNAAAGGGASTSTPQPLSNADQNNVGANDTSSGNQYLSTRDGSPSANGNGGGGGNGNGNNGNGNGNGGSATGGSGSAGAATSGSGTTGEPCAGCVGKADNKNPPGQYPNGSDANNGYECDGNSGVGQTNPAHTGCATTTTTSTTSTTTTTSIPGGGTNGGFTPGGGSTSGGGGSSSVTSVETALQQWLGTKPATTPASVTDAAHGALAFTGAPIERYVLLGFASALVGGALCLLDPWVRRRRAAPER